MRESGSADPRLAELRALLRQALSYEGHTCVETQHTDDFVELFALARQLADARAEVEQRAQELMDVIVALVSFDYGRKATVSDNNDVFDGMAAGLNMLGEELSTSTVSRAYMTNILESMNDAVFVVDRAGVITTANHAAGELLGQASQVLLGQPLERLIPEISVGVLLEAGGARDVELFLSPSNDERASLTTSLSASVMHDRGQIQGLVCVLRDISESRRLEQERSRLREAVQRQAILVEELSTPLIPISAGILVMPLIGPVDEERAAQLIEVLLTGISSKQAKVAILDITGVRKIGPEAVDGIARATRAAALIGAQVVLTGIRPDVVHTLTQLDTAIDDFVTFSSLQVGFVYAMSMVARRRQR